MASDCRGTEVHTAILEDIRSLCLRSYWRRLWIVQEVTLATEIDIQCSFQTCSWRTFALFFRQLDAGLLSPPENVERMSDNPGESLVESSDSSNPLDYRAALIQYLRQYVPARIHEQDRIEAEKLKGSSSNIFRPLLQLCIEYADAECSDQRDKIFGLHSFASPCCREERYFSTGDLRALTLSVIEQLPFMNF
jgi:hypothetical protein